MTKAAGVKLKVAGARSIVMKRCPYVASLLYLLVPREARGLGTIGVTDKGVFLVDFDFVDAITVDELAGGLYHECLHIMGRHADRTKRINADPRLANRAADYAINPAVWEAGLVLPGGAPGKTVDHPFHCLYPVEKGWPNGLTMEDYLNRLRQEPSQPSAGGGNVGNGKCGSCAGHKLPGEDDTTDGAQQVGRSRTEIDRAVRGVAKAVQASKARGTGRGTIPSLLRRWAAEILTPPEVPWEQELAVVSRYVVAWRANAVEHRYDAPSRRQAGIGYGPGRPILPRLREPVPHVAIVFDTSGSMGAQELGEAAREGNGIFKAIGADVTFCACDASVNELKKVQTIDQALASLVGGGGTDMRPALAALREMRPRPDVIVCLTDLAIGDPGPEIDIPVIWVAVGTVAQSQPDPAWGKVIRTTSARAPRAKDPNEEDDESGF